jgi:hypothetical protein
MPEIAVKGVGAKRGFDHGIFEAMGKGHGGFVLWLFG